MGNPKRIDVSNRIRIAGRVAMMVPPSQRPNHTPSRRNRPHRRHATVRHSLPQVALSPYSPQPQDHAPSPRSIVRFESPAQFPDPELGNTSEDEYDEDDNLTKVSDLEDIVFRLLPEESHPKLGEKGIQIGGPKGAFPFRQLIRFIENECRAPADKLVIVNKNMLHQVFRDINSLSQEKAGIEAERRSMKEERDSVHEEVAWLKAELDRTRRLANNCVIADDDGCEF